MIMGVRMVTAEMTHQLMNNFICFFNITISIAMGKPIRAAKGQPNECNNYFHENKQMRESYWEMWRMQYRIWPTCTDAGTMPPWRGGWGTWRWWRGGRRCSRWTSPHWSPSHTGTADQHWLRTRTKHHGKNKPWKYFKFSTSILFLFFYLTQSTN